MHCTVKNRVLRTRGAKLIGALSVSAILMIITGCGGQTPTAVPGGGSQESANASSTAAVGQSSVSKSSQRLNHIRSNSTDIYQVGDTTWGVEMPIISVYSSCLWSCLTTYYLAYVNSGYTSGFKDIENNSGAEFVRETWDPTYIVDYGYQDMYSLIDNTICGSHVGILLDVPNPDSTLDNIPGIVAQTYNIVNHMEVNDYGCIYAVEIGNEENLGVGGGVNNPSPFNIGGVITAQSVANYESEFYHPIEQKVASIDVNIPVLTAGTSDVNGVANPNSITGTQWVKDVAQDVAHDTGIAVTSYAIHPYDISDSGMASAMNALYGSVSPRQPISVTEFAEPPCTTCTPQQQPSYIALQSIAQASPRPPFVNYYTYECQPGENFSEDLASDPQCNGHTYIYSGLKAYFGANEPPCRSFDGYLCPSINRHRR